MIGKWKALQPRMGGTKQLLGVWLLCFLEVLALSVAPALAQTDLLTQAEILEEEAARLSRQGRYVEAISKARESLTLREQTLGPNHLLVASSLGYVAVLLSLNGDRAAARPLIERELRIKEQALGSMHPNVATALSSLASLFQATGDYAGAKPLYERAVRIREQALGVNHPDFAKSLNDLASLFQSTGDYAEARSLYERALRIAEQALGPYHPDVALTLTGLASLLQITGDYSGARPLYERALYIIEVSHGPMHSGVATILNNLAELSRFTGDYAGARPLYERAIRITEQRFGPSNPAVSPILNNLGLLLKDMGEYAAARPLLERALRVSEAALGPEHPDLGTILNNLAELLRTAGDYIGALALHERALKIRTRALGSNHPDVATSLNNLAILLQATGDYAAAKALLERSLMITEDALGPNHPAVATSLSNLAILFRASGDYAAAKYHHERALRIREQALGPNHPEVAQSLNNLAALLHDTSDFAMARTFLVRALQITETTLGANHPDTALFLGNLAMAEWEAGRPYEAMRKLARAVAITRTHTARGLVGLSIRQKMAFLQTTAPFTVALLSMPTGLVPDVEAYRAVLDRKNLLFRTLATERALTEANPDPQVAALLQDYTAVRRRLAALAVTAPDQRDLQQYQTQVASLTQQLEGLESDLSRMSAEFRQAQTEATAGPSDVCAAVPPNAALIDVSWFARGVPPAGQGKPRTWTPHYVAFVFPGGECTHPVRVDLGPASAIDDDVRRFREALSHEAPDPAARELRARYRQAVAARLKAKLFSPEVRAAISGKPRLLISPDGTLALLPFALLPGEDGHEFLLETRTISYVPSGRDLLRAPASPSVPTGLLALGAPAFDRAPVQMAQAGAIRAGCGTLEDPFAPLPGTAVELRAITRVYRQTNPTRPAAVLEGTQATKEALLAKAPAAGVLHLATHAYFAGEDCVPAGLSAPSRSLSLAGDVPAFLGHNPLLLAGIALTGANEREKGDEILTALEVTALDLRGTDLVVLSACDTGLGTPARGQELLGLRWAFAYAGARNFVTSLWSVPDAETAALMTHFYTALWQKGLSVPESLRAAQLEMLRAARAKGDPAPHAWGAFVVSGGPD